MESATTRTAPSLLTGAFAWLIFGAATVICGLWVVIDAPVNGLYPPLIGTLLALACVAEFLPIPVEGRHLRVSFALPFVAAIAVTSQLSHAWEVDLVATTVGYFASRRNLRQSDNLWASLATATCCVAMGGAARDYVGGHVLAQGLAFVLGYGLANFAIFIGISEANGNSEARRSAFAAIRTGFFGYLLFLLVSLTITALASEEMVIYLPFTLLPAWALYRMGKHQERKYEHYYETLAALSHMLQRSHPYTHGHLERVADIAEEVALQMGLTSNRARMVREAAVLHDIGKIAVSEEVLDKPAKLTDEEFAHVKRHAALGADILAPVPHFKEMVPWIRHHHERMDGRGYPDGLTQNQIPLESKIIAVVDAFDAMTGGENAAEKRTYREPKTQKEAIEELERCAGTQFDVSVVDAFKRVVEEGAAWTS